MKPTEFGELITADQVVANSYTSMGVTGDKSAIVIGNRGTGYIEGFPLGSKDETELALMEFAGSAKIRRAWTKCSPELTLACKRMTIIHDKATSGRMDGLYGWSEKCLSAQKLCFRQLGFHLSFGRTRPEITASQRTLR